MRPCAKLTASPAIVPTTTMTANIRSFLSSLAFMMHPRVTPGRLYTERAVTIREMIASSKNRIGFARARVQNTVSFKESERRSLS